MKRTRTAKPRSKAPGDLRAEYHFDYSKAKPNRFASRMKDCLIVVLDPDISRVFTTPDSVNNALRALISAMPKVSKRSGTNGSR